ncbi:lonely Cys domain-containing protein [Streptomyces sp. M19]
MDRSGVRRRRARLPRPGPVLRRREPRLLRPRRPLRPLLRRRPSLAALDADQPVLLVVCHGAAAPGLGGVREGDRVTGALPFVADPLDIVSVAQDVANETGRTVYAHALRTAVVGLPDGDPPWCCSPTSGAATSRCVSSGRSPPGGAGRAGPHRRSRRPARGGGQARALRLVRALREVFGPDVDDAPGYPDLLRGAGAIDLMRAADPSLDRDGTRRFTLDLFQRVVAEDHERQFAEDQAPPLTRDAVRDALGRAALMRSRRPDAVLSDFVSLPYLDQALAALPEPGSAEADRVAREVLGLDPDETLGEAEWSRLAWADTKAHELLDDVEDGDAFTAELLHLDAPDPSRRAEAAMVVRKAMAAGRDPGEFRELAAYHLELQGALSPPPS